MTNLNDTLDVSMPFGKVEGSELGCSLPSLGVGAENGSSSLTLSANNTTHGSNPENKIFNECVLSVGSLYVV